MDKILEMVKGGRPNDLAEAAVMIVEEYRNQARIYASAVLAEASTFNAEMEDTFKPSITKAEYRAKETVGSTKIIAEREMKALEMLFDIVKLMMENASNSTNYNQSTVPEN